MKGSSEKLDKLKEATDFQDSTLSLRSIEKSQQRRPPGLPVYNIKNVMLNHQNRPSNLVPASYYNTNLGMKADIGALSSTDASRQK